MMSTMSASPVKPVMPPPPGVSTPTKVIPSSPSSNVNTPGALQNPVPASPPKNSAPPPISAAALPTTTSAQNNVAKQQIQSQNLNHTSATQMPLSLITTEHKLTAPSSVQSVPATVQPTSVNRTPEKQISQEGYTKPTSNGVEGQINANAAHQPVSLTITPVVPASVTSAAIVPQQPPPVSSETGSSDQTVSCPPNLTFGHAPSASISLTPINPIKTDTVQPLQSTLKQDNLSFNQLTTHNLPSPLNATSTSVKPSPVSSQTSSVAARPAATSDKGNTDSTIASSPSSSQRAESAASPSPSKTDHSSSNKTERPISADVSKAPTPSAVTVTPATIPPPPQPEKKASATTVPSKTVDVPADAEPTAASVNAAEADSGVQQAATAADSEKSNVSSTPEQNVSKTKPSEQASSQPSLVNSTTPVAASKSELKVATIPRGSKRKRETKPQQNSTPVADSTQQTPVSESAKSDASDDRKSKRVRLPTQPYQSPLPEFSLIAKMNKPTPSKAVDDKLIVFYKNEFLAVRNAEGGFYICQAMQNIYKSSPKIRIRWLSQEASTEVYSPDFYDTTDFDCILTNLNLERVEKEKFRLPEVELQRTESILKRALDVEKGVSEKPSVTEEHPDGLDLSLFRDESQLKKTPKKGSSNTTSAAKGSVKKSSRLSRSTSVKEPVTPESVQSDDDKKRKRETSAVVSKPSKKKAQSAKKKTGSGSKKPVAKTPTTVKASPSKKKKKKKAVSTTPAPAVVEPARSTVKRKRSTSTPPAPPTSSSKRAKKSDAATPQVEEKSSKTRNTATVQTASKNRNASITNSASTDKSGTAEATAAAAATPSAPTRSGGTNNSNAAGKDSATTPTASTTTAKDNRERRAAKSRK